MHMSDAAGAAMIGQAVPPKRVATTRFVLSSGPKGGSGKSFICTNLAAAAAKDGYSVALVDFDTQRTATRWLARRPDTAASIVPFEADPSSPQDARDVFDIGDHDVIFIDTPPLMDQHPETLKILALQSDLVIIPTRVGIRDTESVEGWVRTLATMDRDALVVLNAVKKQARRRVETARRRLVAEAELCAVEISDYDDHLTADEAGLGVVEIRGAKGAEDIMAVWAAVRRRLAMEA